MNEIEVYDGTDTVLEMMDKVASRLMKGKSETAIARELGIKRVEVLNYRDQWRERLSNDATSRDMARDHLNMMVAHYDKLISESYKVLDSLKGMNFDEKISAQMNTTIKNISEYEAKRVDALQKAGLLDASDIGDEMAAMEEKQAILIDILRNDLCPTCRATVARKLQQVTNVVEVVAVHEDDLG